MKQRKLNIFKLFFLLFPMQVASQINITGTVKESVSDNPVLYATIFVNGTTNGTITNTSGEFSLDKVIPPCEIVISHISYSTVVIELKQNADTTLQIELNSRDVELGAIEVIDKNRREENLRYFKAHFLGTDYWGKNAYFENDSVLVFRRERLKDGAENEYESGLLETDSSSFLFTVNTKGPLKVQMPLLGYKLHINLIHYTELQTNTKSDYEFHSLGYFYFLPTEDASRRKTNRYAKKRLQAYYNSDRHFCHSLFRNRLSENGYLVYRLIKNPETGGMVIYSSILNSETGETEKNEFELADHIIRTDNEVRIVGLKNKKYNIKYFEKNNTPINLAKREGLDFKLSKIYFLKDTCIIRADGSRPDNSIMFGPNIGNKRVGAMLPYDFRSENIK